MKRSNTSPSINFSELKALSFIHTADWETIELKSKQAHYGRLYQTYNRLLTMNEEGTQVTITVKSSTDSLIINDRSEEYFQLMDYLQNLGNRLTALAQEILDLQQKQQIVGLNNDDGEGVNEQRRLALALCLPVQEGTTLLASDAQVQHEVTA